MPSAMPSPTDTPALPGRLEQRLPWLFAALLALLLALAAWQWRHGAPLSASLLDLLPAGSSDALLQQAEQRVQEPLNRELIVLLQHPDEARAQALVAELGAAWQASGLFRQVQWQLDADLPALRRQLLDGRLALLPAADRRLLLEQPEAFVAQRVQALFDPFQASGLLAVEQDWFGLAARIQQGLPGAGRVQPAADGGLLAERDGKRWRLLRAQTRSDAFDLDLPLNVAARVDAARAQVAAAGGELLAAGGLLHAAHGQQQARHESAWLGGLAAGGALLLTLLLFRRPRVLLALLPALVGTLAGLSACVALFGQIHVLTLVLGASLIGVTIDFPLHYLSKSWSLQPWRPWQALRATLPGLTLGLLTNAIGYLALALTPFPALSQVALFSSVGLLGAWLCTVCLLPALLGRQPLQPWTPPLRLAERLLTLRAALLQRLATPWLLAALGLFCLGGLSQLSLKDDLRQWVSSSPQLLGDARAIAAITGLQPTSQFFLVRAADQEQLLQRQAALAERLDRLVAAGQLHGYLALSQLLAPAAEQQRLRQALPALAAAGAPLQALGVPPEALQAELAQLQELPELDIDQALAGPLGEPWRPLWLGATADGVAALVSLRGLGDSAALAAQAAGLPGVQLVDRPAELNRQFAATQRSAVQLKLLASLLIFLLLCLPFGWRGAARVLAISLLAALAALACLGWLNQPLTLFALFGLLLVTAIGVDYAIIMRERIGGAATSLLGTLLAAVTTWLSFGLLALSSTPAIANFGLTVSLGLVFSFLLAPWAAPTATEPQA